MKRIAIGLTFLAALTLLRGCAVQAHPPRPPVAAERFEFTALAMGVEARIVVYAADEESARGASAAALNRIAALEAIMSNYRPDSELSRLSGAAGRDVQVSPDLWKVLVRSREFARLSGGAFDVTVGPLAQLWRRSRADGALPSAQELADAKGRSGDHLMVIDEGRGTVRLLRAGMALDLGGIAKGYAVQEALDVLRGRGLERALVALAGDIAVGAPPPGTPGWTIRIQTGLAPAAEVVLSDVVISTSGASEQVVEVGGARYAHIVDPRTGLGSERTAAAVVVARDGMDADALGTALFLLGVDAAPQVLRGVPGAQVWVLEAHEGLREFRSPGFPPLRDPGATGPRGGR